MLDSTPRSFVKVGLAVCLVQCGDGSSDGDGGASTTETMGSETMGAETIGSETMGAETTGAEATGAETMGAETMDSTTGGAETCFSPDLLDVLQAHLDDLSATASLIATHPGPLETTGFLLAPALPAPPAQSAVFAGPLIMACEAPLEYEEYCADGVCSQIECTGRGTSWIMHMGLDGEHQSEGWTHSSANVDVSWAEGDTGVTFAIAAMITGPDRVDLSFEGSGAMDLESMSVSETFGDLHPAGPAVLTYTDDPSGHTGSLVIADVEVAVVDDEGQLEWTGACPT